VPELDSGERDESIEAVRVRIPLKPSQKEVLREFYDYPHTRVIFVKSERARIWKDFKDNRQIPELNLAARCPALLAELQKAIDHGKRVQPAVFSECVYAQSLANMLGLIEFCNATNDPGCLSDSIISLLDSYHLKARYVYKSVEGDRILIQAGGHGGVDGALITARDNNVFTIELIEFKEPGAKTSEPDLPPYGEDGNLVVGDDFLANNPQFEFMLNEQLGRGLNFWDVMGTNVNDFSTQGIQIAVCENYAAKKYADVICVEDRDGFLAMIPANQADLWSKTEGEIRPAGRNSHRVWTPVALARFIELSGGHIDNGKVTIPEYAMVTARARGGDAEISRYKVNSLFFVRVGHVENVQGVLHFSLDKVEQLRPTITAKMFFTDLSIAAVQKHYSPEF
jgi:hypothetical protein